MKAFIVDLENRPGELARVAEAIAKKGINITSGSGTGYGDRGAFGFLTNDEAGTRSALQEGNFRFREVEVVPASLEDKPGTLADACRRLANAGVNIELLVPTGMGGGKVTLAIGVDRVDAARTALGELTAAATA